MPDKSIADAIFPALLQELRLPKGYCTGESYRRYFGLPDYHIYIKHRKSCTVVAHFIINPDDTITMSDYQSEPEAVELCDPTAFETIELCAYACCLRDRRQRIRFRIKAGLLALVALAYIGLIIYSVCTRKYMR